MPFCAEDLGAWSPYLQDVWGEPWFCHLMERVEQAYSCNAPKVFPPREELFTALRLTPPQKVKCVIIGQDPYHEEGQAQGLSFSVHHGVPIPRSLKNIYKELQSDLGIAPPEHGSLKSWAEQGVLLLNTVLTVYEGQANSHKNWGWEQFTSRVVEVIESLPQPVAYVLWGKSAQKKAAEYQLGRQNPQRLILQSNHPSPLSANRGFFGSRPFSQVNHFLLTHQSVPIDWSIP